MYRRGIEGVSKEFRKKQLFFPCGLILKRHCRYGSGIYPSLVHVAVSLLVVEKYYEYVKEKIKMVMKFAEGRHALKLNVLYG